MATNKHRGIRWYPNEMRFHLTLYRGKRQPVPLGTYHSLQCALEAKALALALDPTLHEGDFRKPKPRGKLQRNPTIPTHQTLADIARAELDYQDRLHPGGKPRRRGG